MSQSEQEREQLLSAGTAWLLEQELVNSKHTQNFLILNTNNSDPAINPLLTEMLLLQDLKIGIVFIGLNFIGRIFRRQKAIETFLLEEYKRLLPSFRFRVFYDKALFDLSLKRAIDHAQGRTYVQVNDKSPGPDSSVAADSTSPRTDFDIPNSTAPATGPKKEPSGSDRIS